MENYKLLDGGGVIRSSDGAQIPEDERNRDWRKYQAWLSAGNTPDPADPPPVKGPSIEDRLSALEADVADLKSR